MDHLWMVFDLLHTNCGTFSLSARIQHVRPELVYSYHPYPEDSDEHTFFLVKDWDYNDAIARSVGSCRYTGPNPSSDHSRLGRLR